MATATEQFIERVTKLPTSQKAAVIVFIVGGITAGNYFGLIQSTQDAIESEIRVMREEENKWIQNKGIADNLNEYRKQKELLEQRLQAALTEMPEEANIEAIISNFYDLGTKTGLDLTVVEPKAENKQTFYAEIPIVLNATGNFHEIALFFDSVSKMKRIVNVSGLKLTNPRLKNEKLLIDATFVATTFRFVPQPAAQGAK